MKIKLNTIKDVNSFVNANSRYYEGDIDVRQGRQIIDGKSILGMYSLNLIEPLDVTINTDNKNTECDFYNFIKKWSVNEEE